MEETNQTTKRKKIDSTGNFSGVFVNDDLLMKELADTKDELAKTKKQLEGATKKIEELEKQLSVGTEEAFSDDEVDDDNDPWTLKFKELRQYRMVHGHCKVPEKGALPKLGQWVTNQKRGYTNLKQNKKGLKISPDRILKLESIDMFWGKAFPAPPTWEEQYNELSKFKNSMGHCNVFMNAKDPSPLAKWVSFQRSEYKRFRKGQDSLLDLEKIEKLNTVGFNWMGPKLSSA